MGASAAVMATYSPAGSSYDTDAQAYFDAIVTNGGTISTASKGYANTWFLAAKSHSYFTKLKCFNLVMGDQLAAALVQYNGNASTSSVATNGGGNFASGDYTESTGLTGNGTTKYLDTGFSSGGLTTSSTSLSIYNRKSSANGGAHGVIVSSNIFRSYAPYSDGVFYADQYTAGTGGRVSNATGGTPYGFLTASRIGDFDLSIYRNGSFLKMNSNFVAGSVPSGNVYIFAVNSSGATEVADTICAGYFIGDGLSSGNVTDLYNDLQAMQTSLGRNV